MIRHPDAHKVRLALAMGREVRRRREEAGLTQDALAGELRISKNHLQKMETGEQTFTVFHIYELAMLFDCTADDLIPVLTDEVA